MDVAGNKSGAVLVEGGIIKLLRAARGIYPPKFFIILFGSFFRPKI